MTKQTVRTTVEPDVFAALQAQADEQGVSLFNHVRTVLTAHAAVPPEVTPAQWRNLREWITANPGVLTEYIGPRKYTDPAARAAVYQWAQQNGFTPS